MPFSVVSGYLTTGLKRSLRVWIPVIPLLADFVDHCQGDYCFPAYCPREARPGDLVVCHRLFTYMCFGLEEGCAVAKYWERDLVV